MKIKNLNSRFFAIFLLICFVGIFSYFVSKSVESWKWYKIVDSREYLLSGFLMTILISIISLVVSFILGVVLFIFHRSSWYILKYFSSIFSILVESTPMIVYVLVGYYVVAQSLGVKNRFLAGVFILGSFYAVVFSKIIQGGIKSIHSTQWLAGKSLGFSKFQMYWYIIIPQLWGKIAPTLTYQTASLIKDSALLSVISIREFYQVITNTANQTYSTLEFYLAMALGYCLLTIPLKLVAHFLEGKYKYEN